MSDQPKTENPKALFELGKMSTAIAMGIVGAVIILVLIIIPMLGFPGDLARIIKLEDRLGLVDENTSRVLIVSNSAGVEGIDGSIVNEKLGAEYSVENHSSNGLGLISARLYIGRIIESDPQYIVWVLRPELIGRISPMNTEVASAMRYTQFHKYNAWIDDSDIPGIGSKLKDQFAVSDTSNLISLRTIPLRHLNEQLRIRARRGILPTKPMEIDAPFQMDLMLSDAKLDRHMYDVSESLAVRTAGDNRDGIEFIEQTVKQIQQAGVTPILVIAPTHPGAHDAFGPAEDIFVELLSAVGLRNGVAVLDLKQTLGAELFSDAIHPNRDGARVLSELLGDQLSQISTQQEANP